MEKYYLAIDLGASGGRHILGSVRDGRIQLEEIYRFSNGMTRIDGELCWDVQRLFAEIKEGIRRCGAASRVPASMGIDTWGVDFILLDGEDRVLGNAVGYRDGRTRNMDKEVYKIIRPEELYCRTGIQKQIFNTVYQLMAVKQGHPEYLERACSMLMLPDYFHFLLTGVKKQEYTNATTTQLVSPETKEWDYGLIERLGYKRDLFGPLSLPGTVVGGFKKEIQREVGFDCQVVLPATHDTASAVMAVPSGGENVLYISSGTWSLMGTEREKADCSLESMEANFTNEGGYSYRFRYLKNIMGLWMIQSVKKELGGRCSFEELCTLASKEKITSIVPCNDSSYLMPESMSDAVKNYCRSSGQPVPETPGELAAVIYNSLGACYKDTAEEIERLTGRHYESIHIVGGGSHAQYLNRVTAGYTGKNVYAGPAEATAVGNLVAQMLRAGEFPSLQAARESVFRSFHIGRYL